MTMKPEKFLNLPLKSKLRRLQGMTVSLALVFTLLVSTVTQLWLERNQILADAKTTGDMIGFNAAAALLFNDDRSANDILAALRIKPNIIAAQLYTPEGVRFAEFIGEQFADFIEINHFADFPHTLAQAQGQQAQRHLELVAHTEIQQVYQNGETAGYLYLVIDLRPMWWGLFKNLGQISLVMLVAFLLSAFYGRRLAGLIAEPVIRLSQLSQQVSLEKDYTVKAEGEGDDEIGQLVKSFNQMIRQVHDRDVELEQHRGKLEHEVEVRTADLRKSVAEAQAANIAKSQFLATMSHEIRTPMNGVLGMTELLLGTELSLTQRQYAETIITSADALLTLINDILDFSKIEAGKLELEEIDFSLSDLVDQLSALFYERAHSKNIELSCSIDPEVPDAVRGDPYRLRQILTNLMSNAIKFTEVGSVSLHVTPAYDQLANLKGGSYFNFRISDTGIGISQEVKSRLFKSFSQADGSTTRRYGGSGLGLAISKELCELMGGTIEIESEPDEYTVFTVKLFLKKALAPVVAESIPDSHLFNKRVLIVEDNSTNAKILVNYVQNFGMKSRVAENGLRALEILDQSARLGHNYDFALVDMKMRGMNGVELSQHIRNDPRFIKLRIVIITSNAFEGELTSIRASGCDLYLFKPLRKRILQDALLSLVVDKKIISKIPVDQQDARILLAEDNTINQEIVKAILKVIGVRVELAVNGLEALAIFKQGGCDLILMDCMMPEMDGYTATREIRAYEKEIGAKPIPILALTANAMEGDREKCLAAGMTDYLTKPISIEALRNKVITLLNTKPREESRVVVEVAPAPIPVVIPAPTESTPVIRFDPNALNTLKNMGGSGLVANLLNLFRGNAAQQIEKLQEGLVEKDIYKVRLAAHTLKSAAANVGGLHLADLARAIEHAANDGSLVFDEKPVETLKSELQQVLHLISQQDFS